MVEEEMMINFKRVITFLMISALVWFMGCYPTQNSEYDKDQDITIVNSKVRYNNIFPFGQSGKVWNYMDEDGNNFKISVIDTISDEADLYYKVEFREVKLDMVQDDWFINEQNVIKYNDRLNGTFDTFLPSSFLRSGGTFSCGSSNITYEILSSLTLGDKTYTDVLKLTYGTAVLHGFDEILFADNIGIIQMIDYDGRWPVYYTLQ